jgi:hypothetical protein
LRKERGVGVKEEGKPGRPGHEDEAAQTSARQDEEGYTDEKQPAPPRPPPPPPPPHQTAVDVLVSHVAKFNPATSWMLQRFVRPQGATRRVFLHVAAIGSLRVYVNETAVVDCRDVAAGGPWMLKPASADELNSIISGPPAAAAAAGPEPAQVSDLHTQVIACFEALSKSFLVFTALSNCFEIFEFEFVLGEDCRVPSLLSVSPGMRKLWNATCEGDSEPPLVSQMISSTLDAAVGPIFTGKAVSTRMHDKCGSLQLLWVKP